MASVGVPYRQTQTSLLPIFTSIALLIAAVLAVALVGDPLIGWIVAALLVLAAAVVVALSRLTVTVEGGQFAATFRFRWPERRIDLGGVVAARTVRNRWWYGLGIRKIPRGWMYNVWGLDAVELDLESGGVFRVGIADADRLLAAIEAERSTRT
jgi:hypothetical protein